MSSVIYGGVRYDMVRHAIYCKRCETTVESKERHDLKMCSCGSCGVDGGISAGNRILGKVSEIESRAMYRAIVNKKKLWLPQAIIEERFNALLAKN